LVRLIVDHHTVRSQCSTMVLQVIKQAIRNLQIVTYLKVELSVPESMFHNHFLAMVRNSPDRQLLPCIRCLLDVLEEFVHCHTHMYHRQVARLITGRSDSS
jgi:hypothetical protein